MKEVNYKKYTIKLCSSEIMTDLFYGVNTDMNYILLYCLGYGIFEFCNVWTTWINSSETKKKYNVNQNDKIFILMIKVIYRKFKIIP